MIGTMVEQKDKLSELDAVTAQLAKLDKRRQELRDRASALVVDILRTGMPPTEVANRSPFSAAHVRTLARVAGIPPARRGKTKNT